MGPAGPAPLLPTRGTRAQALNKRAPDDLLVYGLLGDAHLELGEYPEAEEALQWMMNLRPGNVAGLTRRLLP